jgi:hypothetical protein
VAGSSRPDDPVPDPAAQARDHAVAAGPAARRGHAFVQNLRHGHYDIATESSIRHRLRIAFDDLALTI